METKPLKLLVIGETPDHLAFLQKILSRAFPGSLLLSARNGITGIQLAKAEDPDVVLLNFTGLDMDGFDICRELKADGRLRDIPLVFLTERINANPEACRKALESGADGFLFVPLEETEVTAQVRTMFRLKAAGRMQRMENEHLAELVAKRTRLLEKELAERNRAEAALIASEAQYRLIAENMSDVISVMDMSLRFTYVSPSIIRLTGYTVEEAVKHTIEEIMPPESLKNIQKIFAEEMLLEASGTADPLRTYIIIEFEQYKKDGSMVWVEAACSFLRDKEHRPEGILVISRDISERKRAGEALRKSEEQYRLIADNMSDVVSIMDMNLRFTYISPSIKRLTGFTAEDSVKQSLGDIMTPASLKNIQKIFEEELLLEAGGDDPCRTRLVEFERYKQDGSVVWVEAACSFLRDKEHRPSEILVITRDISERKRAEAERELLMAAIEQTGEVVVITDPDGIIQYVNPAFEESTGYMREEVVGQNPRILKSGRQDVIFYQQLWETITSGRIWSGRMVNRKKDGGVYTEDATISPVCDAAGRIVNYVGVKRDITDNLRLSAQFQQAQKMESVGRLAGGVAHDFYNMLSVILGYTELAMEQVDRDDPLHADLEEVFKAANRSTDITRQLLAFARQQVILPRTLDLNASIEAMLKMLRRLIGEDVGLTWLPGTNLWPVRMDPSQIDQILANLCVNARDAISDVGSITIKTTNTAYDGAGAMSQDGETASGEFVLISLSDNGCGMDQAIIDKIFEPFFTTKEKGQGTGLGLATVYGIVKQNNGFINVNSEPGKGTTFHIYLPRHTAEALNEMDEKTIDVPRGQGEMILVVDDEFAVLLLAKKILESAGYHALTADTPAEAIRLAEGYAGEIHLLITDVIMPEMNGRMLAERLKAGYPNLKFLYMSGYTGNIILRHGVIGEGVHFIQKPFSIKELALKVRETLDACA